MKTALPLAVAQLFLVACGRPEPATPAVVLPLEDPALVGPMEAAVHEAGRRRWRLAQVGNARFAVEGNPHVVAMTIPSGTCRAFVLVAAPGIHAAASALYLPAGQLLGRDVESETPTVGACAGAEELVAYWHDSVRGAGLVRPLVFAMDSSEAARAGIGEPADAEEPVGRALRRRGFTLTGPAREIAVEAGIPQRFPLEVPTDTCVTLRMSGAEADVRLEVVEAREGGEERNVVARADEGEERALQLCADRGLRLQAVVEPHEHGTVRIRVYRAASAAVGGEAGLWLGERRPALTSLRRGEEGAEIVALAPAEVREATVAGGGSCLRLDAGEGSRGVWIGGPSTAAASVERCAPGVHPYGSIGGGEVRLRITRRRRGPPEASR